MIFLDTNILVYASGINGGDDRRTEAARAVVAAERPFVISVQVIQEFYDRVTRPRGPGRGLGRETALAFVAQWRRFKVEPVSLALFDRAARIEAETGYRYWDCAIIAAAQLAGCRTLLSEDLQHGRTVGDLRIANPFVEIS